MITFSWDDFKNLLSTKVLSLQYIETSDYYYLKAIEGSFVVSCVIPKSDPANSDQEDFETNYKADANAPAITPTQGRFERDDIVLKLAKKNGQADSNGDLALEIEVPGEAGAVTRYAAGGYAYVDNYTWDSSITKVEVVDTNNIFGYGAGTVLKEYHDSEVAEENQGWFFEKSYGSEGNIDIEPMGWYGEMRGGLFLRLTFKVAAAAKVKIILWWGKKE